MEKILNIDKYFSVLLILLLTLGSCKEDDETIYGQSVSERQKEWMNLCNTTLMSGVNGWIFDYNIDESSNNMFFVKFEEDNVVDMVDFNVNVIASQSYYAYNIGQGVVLSFNTGSALSEHINKSSSNSDIEFIIDDITPDSIVLTGRKYQKRSVLRRLDIGGINKIILERKLNLSLGLSTSFFHQFKSATGTIDVMMSDDKSSLDLFLGNEVIVNSNIRYTEEGFELETPVTIDGVEVKTFVREENTEKFYANNNSVELVATNTMEFYKDSSAELFKGYFEMVGGSSSVNTWIAAIERENNESTFKNFKYFDVYADVSLVVETISYNIIDGDTIEVSRVENNLPNYTAISYVLERDNFPTWNNFKSAGINTLRADQIKIRPGVRDGLDANAINKFPSSSSLNKVFFDTNALTVYVKSDLIYLVSATNAKNWLIVKKKADQNPKQIKRVYNKIN